MSHHILITGYRQQLAKAINKLGIPYSIVSEKAIKTRPAGVVDVFVTPFDSIKSAQDILALKLKHKPTHVIAGTESGVYLAAELRRLFNARSSSKTLLTRCTDKTAMKTYLSQHNIPMAGFVTHSRGLTAEALVETLGLPVVVKDRKNSGGRNVVIAQTVEELRPLLAPQRLYEQFIQAAEGSIESFVENGKIIFSSITEYHTLKVANVVPASYLSDEAERIHALNQNVIKTMKIKWGLTHLEYYREQSGEMFGEIALRPPGGYIMELIKGAYDFDPWEVFVKIELGLPVDCLPQESRPIKHERYCGVVLFHPGAGTVTSIKQPNKTDFPSLVKVSIKVKEGDLVSPRHGVGEDVGYCLLSSENYADVSRDIDKLSVSTPVRVEK